MEDSGLGIEILFLMKYTCILYVDVKESVINTGNGDVYGTDNREGIASEGS